MPLFRELLDSLPCGCCGKRSHGPAYFHGRCHPAADMKVEWDEGVCKIACGKCGKLVVEVLADEPEFDLPDELVEAYYQEGEVHLKGFGSFPVGGDPNLN